MWVALREALGLSERVFPFEAKARKLHLDAKKRVRLEPDLSWWEGRRCVWVGDAKYKRITVKGVKHPDIYQMLSCTTATGLDTGMLIYAKGEAEPVIHDIPMAGRSIEVRALDLSGAPDEILGSVVGLAQVIRSRRARTLGGRSSEKFLVSVARFRSCP